MLRKCQMSSTQGPCERSRERSPAAPTRAATRVRTSSPFCTRVARAARDAARAATRVAAQTTKNTRKLTYLILSAAALLLNNTKKTVPGPGRQSDRRAPRIDVVVIILHVGNNVGSFSKLSSKRRRAGHTAGSKGLDIRWVRLRRRRRRRPGM